MQTLSDNLPVQGTRGRPRRNESLSLAMLCQSPLRRAIVEPIGDVGRSAKVCTCPSLDRIENSGWCYGATVIFYFFEHNLSQKTNFLSIEKAGASAPSIKQILE